MPSRYGGSGDGSVPAALNFASSSPFWHVIESAALAPDPKHVSGVLDGEAEEEVLGLGHIAEVERLILGALERHVLDEVDLLVGAEPVLRMSAVDRHERERDDECKQVKRVTHA